MKPKNLQHHVNAFYQQQTLSENRLQALMDQANSSTHRIHQTNNNLKARLNKWFNLNKPMMVTISLLLIAVPISLPTYHALTAQAYSLQTIIAKEIALNHRKQLNLEFHVNNYSALSDSMKKLDFPLIASTSPALNGLTIMGARYCSIQGSLAAQIRLTDKKGKHYTLYQTPFSQFLLADQPSHQIIDNIEVQQWIEDNTFYGLAHAALSVKK